MAPLLGFATCFPLLYFVTYLSHTAFCFARADSDAVGPLRGEIHIVVVFALVFVIALVLAMTETETETELSARCVGIVIWPLTH